MEGPQKVAEGPVTANFGTRPENYFIIDLHVMKQLLLTAFLLLSFFSTAGAAEMKETYNLNGKAVFFDWHYSHYEEPGLMTVQSRFPFSFSVGFRDETNIRSP